MLAAALAGSRGWRGPLVILAAEAGGLIGQKAWQASEQLAQLAADTRAIREATDAAE